MVTTTDTDPVQYEIFPQRMLDPSSAQELLNRLEQIEGVTRVLVQGPRLPLTVPYGPGKGAPVDHTDRGVIRVGDQVMELQVKVGRIRLEAEHDVMEEIKALCEELFSFPFELKEGLFLRRKATVTDYAKYGPDELVEDKRIYGMTDPSMTPTSKICESCVDTRE